jgi:predicted metal-dependent peptidase
VNPVFFKEKLKNADERLFVLSHEVLHVIFRHCPRLKNYMDRGFGPDLKPFNPKKWNRATDYIINHTLYADNIGEMPDMCLYSPKYTSEMLADDVYVLLDDDEDDDSNADSFDTHVPAGEADSATADANVKRALAGAAQAAKSMGKLPAQMKRLVDELLEPQITWGEKLRMQITMKAGRDMATWNRPNRRRLASPPHLYLPGSTGIQAGRICMYIDTSGSVSNEELQAFLTEVAGLYQDTNPEELWLGSCDAEAYDPIEIQYSDEILEYEPEGGGGTHMPAIYTTLEKVGLVPEVLVILTDGYTGWDEAPDYPVVVVTTSDQECPYAENIRLHVGE